MKVFWPVQKAIPWSALFAFFCSAVWVFGQTQKTPIQINYTNATVNALKPLAEKGDSKAQHQLGLTYAMRLKNVPLDYGEAFKWFSMAADQGMAMAQHNLAGLYFYGLGVPQDYKEALKWYLKAAEQGFAPAQFFLGWAYANGRGVDESFKEAVKWYLKGAEQGDKEAQYNLGLMYLRGEDLNPDYVEAYKWINLSAAQGNTNAIKSRSKISISMTPEQISEGQRRASQFIKKDAAATPKNAAAQSASTNAPTVSR